MFDSLEAAGATSARTLKTSVMCEGIGLHSGRVVKMTLMPAPVGTGILFRRRDLLSSSGPEGQTADLERVTIQAIPQSVTATTLGTVISNRHGVSVSTIEHIMSAFAGCGIDHAIVELDGPELPIMDGSAEPFVKLIESVGLRQLPAARQALLVKETIRIEKGDSFIEVTPLGADEPLGTHYDVTVAFDDPAIGEQRYVFGGEVSEYRDAIAAARTFCYLKDVEATRAMGLGLGGSLDNTIVVSDGEILNEEGLRFEEEFVRHKALDLVGDLYLMGMPILGRIRAHKPGHGINTAFALKAIESALAEKVSLEAIPSKPAAIHA